LCFDLITVNSSEEKKSVEDANSRILSYLLAVETLTYSLKITFINELERTKEQTVSGRYNYYQKVFLT
jgi:hypothetical protein